MAKKRAPDTGARRPAKRRSVSGSKRRSPAGKAPPRRSAARRPPSRRRRSAWTAAALVGGALVALLALAWLMWPTWRLARGLTLEQGSQPTLVYGRPELLRRGDTLDPEALAARLRALGYRPTAGSPAPTGSYRVDEGAVEVGLRPAPTAAGLSAGRRLEVGWAGRRVSQLSLDGVAAPSVELDRPLIGLLVGDDLRYRQLVRRAELPQQVVLALLAAEDDTFFEHPGISLSGLLRAAVVNFRSGEVQQGGSTLTQQLVKNVFLTPERTLPRKLREGWLSLLVELRFDKDEILEAYLNEAYWGSTGGVHLMGLGAAARFWFGCDARELDVAEAALLAGMLRSPGSLDPARHPEAARARRDDVLARMRDLGWLEASAWERATHQPVTLYRPAMTPRTRDYFLDAVAREARRRFGLDELRQQGLAVLTTLDLGDQRAAEEAIAAGLERGEETGAETGLQGALVSLQPASGDVLAWVGGRDYRTSQFDRVELARRQPGSAFKPIIFTAAFARGVATPSTLIEDAPLQLESGGEQWEPHNVDHRYRGWVTARQALEQSVNVAAVRLGERTGWERVVAVARDLGIDTPLEPLPSLALGAFEVAPLRLAEVYATLANGGLRAEPHLIEAVLDRDHGPLPGAGLERPHRVLPAAVAYQVSYVLRGVLDRGTGASARRLGVADPLAGKTGTTNGGRDSWFAGFSPDRATLVWVGYDDNRGSRLSGNRAALPIWARFAAARRPPGGYAEMAVPAGVEWVEIDPETGGHAGRRCPQAIDEVFLDGTGPETECYLHAGGRRPLLEVTESEEWRLRQRPWWRRGILRRRGDERELPPRETPR